MLVAPETVREARSLTEMGPTHIDPVRVIASIAQGIGFLGAGTILVTRASALGLTTAAATWATSAYGAACGLGLWQIAFTGTILAFIALQVLGPLTPYITRTENRGS